MDERLGNEIRTKRTEWIQINSKTYEIKFKKQ